MTRTISALATCAWFTVSLSAAGQVYETRDAEGNAVFTDTPAQGSQEITVPQTNVSDTVEPSADADGSPAAAVSEKAQQAESGAGRLDSGNVVVIGDEATERENQYIDNEGRREVRDAEKRQEVLEADPRHEVR